MALLWRGSKMFAPIATFKQETRAVEVDYELIASRIKDARKAKDPRERRQTMLDWVEKVRLGDGSGDHAEGAAEAGR